MTDVRQIILDVLSKHTVAEVAWHLPFADDLVEALQSSEVWLTRPELAERWKMPPGTLDHWASQRRGPRYAKFGRHARYRLSDVVAWESARLST